MRWPQVDSDTPWDSSYLELSRPPEITKLTDLGDGVGDAAAISPLAITSPFRILSDEGVSIVQSICSELAPFASGDHRISRRVRSGCYQSEFLRGLASDPAVIEFFSALADVPLAAHPISHQAIHINYAPDDLTRNVVDDWHRDTGCSFDYVLMVSDPAPMVGGRFEYFAGSAAEADELIAAGGDLPAERIVQPDFPGPGWAVFMQGHQLVHRAHRLYEPYPRITLIGSFVTVDVADPQDTIGPTVDSDPEDVALIEWSRYTAVVAARRLAQAAEATTDLSIAPAQLRQALEESVAGPLDAIERLRAFENA